MTLITGAGWILCAALFGTLTANVFHLDYAGWIPDLLLVGFAALACLSPRRALLALLVLIPVVSYLASHMWNPTVSWAEALACAALTGFALDGVRRTSRVPATIRAPALLFGALVLAALVAALGVLAMKFGPVFTPLLASQITREFFTDTRTSPALHAGLLLLEGTLLAVHAARLAAERPIATEAASATAIGASLSAGLTLLTVLQTAWHHSPFVPALLRLVATERLHVTFADVNAAGSYYAMALLIAIALLRSSGYGEHAHRGLRAVWITCTVIIAVGLWLTSSRFALLAVPAAAGILWLAPRVASGGATLRRSAAIAVAACAVLVLISVALPKRGIQHGVGTSLGVRIGLLETASRMIKTHPAFGIGLGEFYPRSAEYSSPELLAKFPAVAAFGENAHNNFMQIAAELGVVGGILFTWIVAAALIAGGARAIAAGDRFLLLLIAGVAAFVLTCLGGHPLLIPEPGYVFWMWIGLLSGHGARETGHGSEGVGHGLHGIHGRLVVGIALAIIVLTLPWRMRTLAGDTNFEHVGINVSPLWQVSPDGIKYRSAQGHATLFVPTKGFKVSVNLRSDQPARLEMRLDGHIADVKPLTPNAWTDLAVPGRTQRATSLFARFDLRLLEGDQIVMWITKVQPLD